MNTLERLPSNLAFIDEGKKLEVEAISGGRRTNQLSMGPPSDSSVLLPSEDDAQETTERINTLSVFLPHVERAFKERGLIYPFSKSQSGDSLQPLGGQQDFAKECAKLTGLGGLGDKSAKEFERRAVKALHQLIGGWGIGIGAPRDNHTGPEKAVSAFRNHLQEFEKGSLERNPYPKNGDLGGDGLWILGRKWCGPVVFLQVKNSAFSISDPPTEFQLQSDIVHDWFGYRIDQTRTVIPVLAINSYLTARIKSSAFMSGRNFHILDAVDILYAERLSTWQSERDSMNNLEVM